MSEESEWIKNLVPPEDIADIESNAKRIEEAHGTFYEMSVMMSLEDMRDAVRAGYGMRLGDEEAWMLGVSILMSLLGTMEIALKKDDIDIWKD
jgi:hypothetical protein